MRGRRLAWTALLLPCLLLLDPGCLLAPAVSRAGEPKTLLDTLLEKPLMVEPDPGLPPSVVRGQDATGYALPDVVVPSPLTGTRPEEGCFFYGTFTMYLQTMTLGQQTVAVRG